MTKAESGQPYVVLDSTTTSDSADATAEATDNSQDGRPVVTRNQTVKYNPEPYAIFEMSMTHHGYMNKAPSKHQGPAIPMSGTEYKPVPL